ncbi:hypothetical protein DFH27DRAFT_609947 [Peziza echinospora]|nr:hypothetical protein DFH27DRAFT_609947 [Peziza echinospora]
MSGNTCCRAVLATWVTSGNADTLTSSSERLRRQGVGNQFPFQAPYHYGEIKELRGSLFTMHDETLYARRRFNDSSKDLQIELTYHNSD